MVGGSRSDYAIHFLFEAVSLTRRKRGVQFTALRSWVLGILVA